MISVVEVCCFWVVVSIEVAYLLRKSKKNQRWKWLVVVVEVTEQRLKKPLQLSHGKIDFDIPGYINFRNELVFYRD
jgi:hypothetical protein